MSAADVATLLVALVSAGIALYAAALSRRALAWQQDRDAERQETKVRIEFDHSAEDVPVMMFVGGRAGPSMLYYQLTMSVVNDGETTEYVTGASLDAPDGSSSRDLSPYLKPDRELSPRGRVAIDVPSSDLSFKTGFVGVARLASGQELRSAVEHLDAEIEARIADNNRRAER
jgi:hypothetical protein